MAAAGKWKIYEEAKLAIANGEIDLADDAFEIALYLSTSNCDTLTGTRTLAALTNQVATNFGYTQADGSAGGKVIDLTTGNTTGTIKIDAAADPVWTASGGSIVTRFAVIIDGTTASNQAIAVCLLDTAPADVTATDGNTLTLTMNAAGLFTLSGATSN